MNSARWIIKTAAAIAIAGVITALLIHNWAANKLRAGDETLLNGQRRLSEFTPQRESPPLGVTHSNSSSPDSRLRELEQLKAERDQLRNETNQLASALAQLPRWGSSTFTHYSQHTNSPEQTAQTDAIIVGKKQDVQTLSTALNRYLTDHQGQFPSSTDQLDSYLRENNLSLSGTNQFDVVYNGTVDQLTNFPLRSVAILRERQSWPSPDGRSARIYGMYGGGTVYAGWSKLVYSDDFDSFESQNIVSLPNNPVAQ